MSDTKPTTPGIAELLAQLEGACAYGHGSVLEARARVLAHVADLEAQRDEALKDAGRYRLLRTKVGFDARYGSAFLACGLGKIDPEETDRAIDAAIAQRGGKSE